MNLKVTDYFNIPSNWKILNQEIFIFPDDDNFLPSPDQKAYYSLEIETEKSGIRIKNVFNGYLPPNFKREWLSGNYEYLSPLEEPSPDKCFLTDITVKKSQRIVEALLCSGGGQKYFVLIQG